MISIILNLRIQKAVCFYIGKGELLHRGNETEFSYLLSSELMNHNNCVLLKKDSPMNSK